jgi:hypothetical protein
MAWKGLRDGCPEQHVLRAQGGSGEDAEGISATGSGACKPRRWDSPLLQSGNAGQDGRTIGSRYDYAKSLLCHLITSSDSERFYLTACSLFAASMMPRRKISTSLE